MILSIFSDQLIEDIALPNLEYERELTLQTLAHETELLLEARKNADLENTGISNLNNINNNNIKSRLSDINYYRYNLSNIERDLLNNSDKNSEISQTEEGDCGDDRAVSCRKGGKKKSHKKWRNKKKKWRRKNGRKHSGNKRQQKHKGSHEPKRRRARRTSKKSSSGSSREKEAETVGRIRDSMMKMVDEARNSTSGVLEVGSFVGKTKATTLRKLRKHETYEERRILRSRQRRAATARKVSGILERFIL